MEVLGFDVPLWLLIGLFLFYLIYRRQTSEFDIFKQIGVPGPKPWPFLGTMHLMFRKSLIKHDEELHKEYGSLFGLFMGRMPVLMVNDPEILKQIMVKNFSSFRNRQKFFSEPPFDKMMTMLDDDHWKYVRNHVSPSFSGQKLRRITPMLNKCCQTLVNNLRVTAKAGDAFDVKDFCGSFTMDAIASTAFSIDIDSKNDKNNKFVRMAKEFLDLDKKNGLFILIMTFPAVAKLLKFFGISILNKEAGDFFKDIVQRSIKDREDNPGESPNDFLQMLLDARVEDEDDKKDSDKITGLTQDEILSQAILFFVGGYENIALSISWTLYCLALHQDYQEKVHDEIINNIGQNEPDYDNIKNLSYLDMCISESMRIFPLGFRVDRVTSEDITIQGIKIPQGMDVGIPVYVLHNDPEVWPEPQKYEPDRFTEEAKSSRHEFSYMPFGMGPRNCVAKRLADIETRLCLVHLIRSYKFVTCDKTVAHPPEMKAFKMEPKEGIWLKAEARN